MVPAACAALLVSCSATPPPGWATGGAPLVFANASWQDGDGTVIDLSQAGLVTSEGHLLFILDGSGRAYTKDREPLAMVLPDGNIAGTDQTYLGRIGITNASPPGGTTAWLTLREDGSVIHFDEQGERLSDGKWQGCDGPQLRTCTLVTHLVTLERSAAAARGGVYVGFGVGFWP
jgi:hypothetical protein